MTVEERFWARVDRRGPAECWEWQGPRHNGYGSFYGGREARTVRTHRFAYELLAGPVPAGLVLDHLCRNRACCNPAHLEPVTNRENILRGEGFPGLRARQTHCKHGHELSGDNLRIDRGCRDCWACRREGWKHTTARRSAERAARRRAVTA